MVDYPRGLYIYYITVGQMKHDFGTCTSTLLELTRIKVVSNSPPRNSKNNSEQISFEHAESKINFQPTYISIRYTRWFLEVL